MYYPFIKIGPFGMEPAAYIFVETLQNKIRGVEFYFMALKNQLNIFNFSNIAHHLKKLYIQYNATTEKECIKDKQINVIQII